MLYHKSQCRRLRALTVQEFTGPPARGVSLTEFTGGTRTPLSREGVDVTRPRVERGAARGVREFFFLSASRTATTVPVKPGGSNVNVSYQL